MNIQRPFYVTRMLLEIVYKAWKHERTYYENVIEYERFSTLNYYSLKGFFIRFIIVRYG